MEQNMELLDKPEVQEMLRYHREIIYKKINDYHNGFCLRILENICVQWRVKGRQMNQEKGTNCI